MPPEVLLLEASLEVVLQAALTLPRVPAVGFLAARLVQALVVYSVAVAALQVRVWVWGEWNIRNILLPD